jgi:kynurenine formamidase
VQGRGPAHAAAGIDVVGLPETGAGARVHQHADYVDSGCGMGRAATLHLTGQGVRVVGTDAWSWDGLPETGAGARVHQHDVEGLQDMADAGELAVDLVGSPSTRCPSTGATGPA